VARYSLNLPSQLKQAAEEWASRQGVSLNQFILWAVSEKVGALNQNLDDEAFPQITYRRGAANIPRPILRGTGIHVQAVAVAHEHWQMSKEEIAEEYGLSLRQVEEALSFFEVHRVEIETHMAADSQLAQRLHG